MFVGTVKGLGAEPGDKGQIETPALIGVPPNPPPLPFRSPIRFGEGVRDAWSDLPLFHVTDARVCLRAGGAITLKQQ